MQLIQLYKKLQNYYSFLIISFLLGCIGCRTYNIPIGSFKEQFKGFDSTNLRKVLVRNSKGTLYKYYANPIDSIKCLNLLHRHVIVQNSPSIELRLKRKKNKKVVLFFDSVILKDSLISGKSSRLYGSNQYIPINDVRKIKVHIKDKKEHYFKYISNRIEIGKPLGLVYRKEGKHLSPDKLIDITKANTFAFKEMNMARSYYDASILSGITGGFLIAYALITDINTKNSVIGIGIGLIGLSIPLSIEYFNHSRKAVNIYNKGLRKTGLNRLEIIPGLTSNGFSLRMIF